MGYVTYVYITMERTTIMADWPNNRCGVFVMFASSYFKPDDDPRSPGDFGSDNIRFCMGQLAKAVMGTALAPYNKLLEQQSNNLNDNFISLNYLRKITKTMMDAFMSFLEPFFKKFTLVAYQIGAVVQHLKMAMGRVNAILTSFVYQGISLVTGIQNMIQFVFVVIMIILGIMIALLILLFFILFPFIPILITPVIAMIIAVGGSVMAETASTMNDSFCFVPETPVILATGATKAISEIQLGDVVQGGGTVTGILRMDGSTTPLYDLEGIRVSGSHLVNHQGKWQSVSEDSRSVPVQQKESVLHCLNTTNRLIPVQTNQGSTVLFRDWEELEEKDTTGQEAWDRVVSKILGGVSDATPDAKDTFCLMDGANTVMTETGIKSLKEVVLGDKLQLSYNRYTTVIGLVDGYVTGTGSKGWMSACIKKRDIPTEMPYQRISTITEGEDLLKGRHLITECGEFVVGINGTLVRVRDFTEVGADLIHLTYPLVAKSLNHQP
jgi:hypothetical protein